jgi:S-adenosylmethionine uptake transporter
MKIPANKAALGASLVVLSSFFYAMYGVWTRLMGDAFGGYQQALIRSVIVVAVLLPIAAFHKQLSRLHWRRDAHWFALSLISSALISGPIYYAVLRVGIALSTAILYAGIIVGMFLFGWVFNRERYTLRKFAATALAGVGLWCVFAPSIYSIGVLPLIAALGAGLATGLNIVSSQKMPYNASQTTIIAWMGGILANIGMLYLTGDIHHPLHFGIAWLYIVLFGLTCIVASWSVIRGVKLIDAGTTGILSLLEIVFGSAFGMIFFGERPAALALAGMGIIIAAAAIPYLGQIRLYTQRKSTPREV